MTAASGGLRFHSFAPKQRRDRFIVDGDRCCELLPLSTSRKS